MCGILGYITARDTSGMSSKTFSSALKTISHRGKDSEGFCVYDGNTITTASGADSVDLIKQSHRNILDVDLKCAQVVFGHRRLSIIDLSTAGHQPMSYAEGRYWIVFNGEIYNYIELRAELEELGYRFRTNTDTEVILAAYSCWDRKCVSFFNGMWAFAIFDKKEKTLFFSRDRFGVKPFYYTWDETSFAFASEQKALLKLSDKGFLPDKQVVYDYLCGFEQYSEKTFFQNILQLEPGTNMVLRILDKKIKVEKEKYYSLRLVNSEKLSFEECEERFLVLLKSAISLRLRSDVPVGFCMSGGLDSTTLVALSKELNVNENLKTFSIIFDDPDLDERRYISQVRDRLKVENYQYQPDHEGLWHDLDALIWHQDEPFGSSSIFAQWAVMRLAAQNGIKVVIDGQGADEILAGYPVYYSLWIKELLQKRNFLLLARELLFNEGGKSRKQLAGLIAKQALGKVDEVAGKPVLDRFIRPEFRAASEKHSVRRKMVPLVSRQIEDETIYNLPKLLRYEDRNSMAFTIESRMPFTDFRIVEFLLSVPPEFKLKNGWSKYLLRRAMHNRLPESVLWRKEKWGFVTPEKKWMQALMPRLHNLFSKGNRLLFDEYYDTRSLSLELPGLLTKAKKQKTDMWRVVNLEIWLRKFFS